MNKNIIIIALLTGISQLNCMNKKRELSEYNDMETSRAKRTKFSIPLTQEREIDSEGFVKPKPIVLWQSDQEKEDFDFAFNKIQTIKNITGAFKLYGPLSSKIDTMIDLRKNSLNSKNSLLCRRNAKQDFFTLWDDVKTNVDGIYQLKTSDMNHIEKINKQWSQK